MGGISITFRYVIPFVAIIIHKQDPFLAWIFAFLSLITWAFWFYIKTTNADETSIP